MSEEPLTIKTIQRVLQRLGGYGSVYIPEFTWGGYRVDGLVVDTGTRWIRGFEIKMSRSDFLRDEKWHNYAQFCSSLSMVCPAGLIQPKEIDDPFGLLWVKNEFDIEWVKKPKRFQRRGGLAWTFTYLKVLEYELPRLSQENERLKYL